LSVEPDVVYLSDRAIDTGRVRLIPKAGDEPDRFIEIEGPPDLVVEIVSDSAAAKDTQRLPIAYLAAGVRELWIIDARGETPAFRLLTLVRGKYIENRPDKQGFRRSPALKCAFCLVRKRNRRGRYVYQLKKRAK
jgi:Uma2 family endonuclease